MWGIPHLVREPSGDESECCTTHRWDRPPHRKDPLWARARAGNHDAFCDLVEEFFARLVAYAKRLLRRADGSAYDVVQDALLLAWERRERISCYPHLRSWLYLVVRRLAISRMRKRTRAGHGFVSIHKADKEDPIQRDARPRSLCDTRAVTPTARRLSRVQITDAMVRVMQSCSRTLAPNDLAALELFHLHNLSTRDIAEVLGISRTAVKMRLMRARDRLRASLHQHAEDAISACEDAASEAPRERARAVSPSWAKAVREWMSDYEHSRSARTTEPSRRSSP